jgi:hypothetical protein
MPGDFRTSPESFPGHSAVHGGRQAVTAMYTRKYCRGERSRGLHQSKQLVVYSNEVTQMKKERRVSIHMTVVVTLTPS